MAHDIRRAGEIGNHRHDGRSATKQRPAVAGRDLNTSHVNA